MATVTATQERLFLDGEWIETGEWIEVRSPYSGDVVATVAKAGADEVGRAIDAAERVMRDPLPAWQRADILDRAARLIEERGEELARSISIESGKPIKNARIEAARAVNTYGLSSGEARRLAGEVVPVTGTQSGAGHIAWTIRVPIGVIGAISPFNFPLNLVAHKLAPALAAGCAVVLKPASSTPVTALRLAAILDEAGLPPGWLHVLPGSGTEIGGVLAEDERVRMITFTGSGEVGWGIRQRAFRKKVALELGNASPVLVEADADLELAAQKVATHAFGFAGQTCVSVQRVYVRQEVYDDFVSSADPEGRRAEDRRSGRRLDRRRPGHRPRQSRARARVDRGGEGWRCHRADGRRRGGRRHPSDRSRRREPRDEGLPRGDLRAGLLADALLVARGGLRASRTRPATAFSRRSSPARSSRRSRRPGRSSSEA